MFISFSPGCLLSSTFLGSLGRSSSLTYSGPPQGGLQYGSNCLSTAGWWGELSCCQCLPWGLWMTRALCTSTLVPTALVFLCGSLGLTLSYSLCMVVASEEHLSYLSALSPHRSSLSDAQPSSQPLSSLSVCTSSCLLWSRFTLSTAIPWQEHRSSFCCCCCCHSYYTVAAQLLA